MGGVDADIHQVVGVQHVQGNVLGEHILLAVLLQHHGGGDLIDPGGVEGDVIAQGQGAAGGNGAHIGGGGQDLTAHGVGDGLDIGVGALAVEQGGGDGHGLAGDGGGGAAGHIGDAQLQGLAHPHGSGDRQVAVTLGDADVVVAVVGVQGHGQVAGGQDSGIVPGIGGLAGVDNDLHLGDGIAGVGVVDGNMDVQLLGDLGEAAAQEHAVDGVADLQVLVLGGVHTHGPQRVIDALLAEVVGEDHVAGVVGVAPAALVVILVVGGGQVPALIQRHGVILIAGIIAAGADLALAVAGLHHVHTAVDDGIPEGEVTEGAEGVAGVVELAEAVCALLLAQQSIVGAHTGIVGLVVQGGVVAGDDTGGIEGVDVAGAAGPGHLEARQSHQGTGVGLVEGGHGGTIAVPGLLAGGAGQAHVVQSALGVGGAGGVKVVGVVGEGHKLHVGAVGQVLHIVQGGVQGACAVGILGVAVELAEVQLILGLAHGEEPVEGGGLAVGAGNGDGHIGAAVGHVGGGGIGELAAGVHGVDLLTVDGHLQGGILTGVDDLGGNHGPLVAAGLAALQGGHSPDGGLVHHGEHQAAGIGRAGGVGDADGEGHLVGTGQHGGGDIGGVVLAVGGVVGDDTGGLAVHQDLQLGNGLDIIDGEGQGIVLTGLHGVGGGEHHGGIVDHAAVQLHAVGHTIEEEGVDGVVGDVVHAVGLIAVAVILQILAVPAVELGGAAFQLIAAHAAAAGLHGPVGVLAGGLGIEGVVAGAVGAQIAVGFVAEAVILAAALHGEHHAAVFGDGLAVRDLGGDTIDGGAVGVVILPGQDALGILVEQHYLRTLLGQAAGGLVHLVAYQIELLGKQSLVAADGAEGTPVVLLGIPLQIAAAAHVLDIVAALGGSLLQCPGGVGLVQGSAGVFFVHGQLLALGGGEGIGAALGAVHGPQLCIRVAGELASGQLHIHACVIEAVVHGGQSLLVGGVEHHHLVAVLQGGQIGDDAAFPGGDGAELPEAQGLPSDIGVDRSVAAPILVVVHAHIAGQCHVLQIAGLRVHHPVAVFAGTLADAVVAAGGIQVLAGGGGDQLEAVSALDDLPAEQVLLRCGQRIAADGTGDGLGRGLGVAVVGQHPGAVALGHGNGDGVVGRDIGQLHLRPCPCLRLCREYRHRQQGNQHDQ